jgi:hypothetical protein
MTRKEAYLKIVEGWLRNNRGIHFTEGAIDDLCDRIAAHEENTLGLHTQIARLKADHNLETLDLREELILAKCQLESVLAILRRTYDDVRDQQTRRSETKRD